MEIRYLFDNQGYSHSPDFLCINIINIHITQMEKAVINRDNSMTIEQQIAMLTQRITQLEEIVDELQKPLTWQTLEATQQFV